MNQTTINKIQFINKYRIKRQEQTKKKFISDNIKKYIEIRKKLSIRYPIKEIYNSVIPFKIFQTWHTKNLTFSMFQSINMIIQNNPKFKYYLFDDNNCREFIQKNYNSSVLDAFDTLIPGAYKADLWRYCVLYKEGGIYLDIKYRPINNFNLINLTEKEHWVLDADGDGIYNALIVVKPGNNVIKRAIDQVVENVQKRYYGNSQLEPTGPKMLSPFFSYEQKKQFDMKHEFYFGDLNNRVINFNNIPVFKSYNGYLDDHNKAKKTEYYGVLWSQRRIYN